MVAKIYAVTFEDALTMTGFGKFNFLSFLTTVCLISGMGMEIMSVAYLVPASACELNTTSAQQGFMAGMTMLGIITTSNLWGYLADTRGRRKILAWCMTLSFCAGTLAAFSPNWIVFSILKFLSSCAVSGTYALAVTLLSETTPMEKRNMMVALTSSIFVLATGIMAVIAIPVLRIKLSYFIPYLNIYFDAWRILAIVFTMPCAIGAICMYFAYESPRFLLRIGKEEKALDVLQRIYKINMGRTKEDYQVHSVILGEDTGEEGTGLWSSLKAQTLPLLKPPLLRSTLLLSVLFIIVYSSVNPYIVWLPYIVDAISKSLENGGENLSFCDMVQSAGNVTVAENHECSLNEYAMTSVFVIHVVLAILNVFLSTIIDVVGRKQMLIGVQLVTGIAGICSNFSTSWVLNSFFFIIFISGMLNFGFLTTFSVAIFPTYVKAMAVCLTLMVGRGSSVLGINVLKNLLVSNCTLANILFPALTIVPTTLALLLGIAITVGFRRWVAARVLNDKNYPSLILYKSVGGLLAFLLPANPQKALPAGS